jgi:glycosyltransferase involved in cell wall biosynthesis
VRDLRQIPQAIAVPTCWHLVTGEYPPDVGGVSDYTAAVGAGLADAGAEVHVWRPAHALEPVRQWHPVIVHNVAGRFDAACLVRLDHGLERFAGPRTILIQYTPQAFGCKAMNLLFATWVAWRACRGDDVRVMFHEVAFPWVRHPLRHNVLAAANRAMAALLVRSCAWAYVSIPAWVPLLRQLGAARVPIAWTPVPANVPGEAPAAAVAVRRAELTRGDPAARVICHFGTYGAAISRTLAPVLQALLALRPEIRVLLLGAGGERWGSDLVDGRADWASRVVAPGALPAAVITEYLQASDLAFQPYPDGASGRRTTLMAALANGVPVITTIGRLSEPIWGNGAVAVAPAGDLDRLAQLTLDLLDRPNQCDALGRAGRRLYQDRFAIDHTIAALLDLSSARERMVA